MIATAATSQNWKKKKKTLVGSRLCDMSCEETVQVRNCKYKKEDREYV
jgi:histidinol phosphatase-like enzyme